MVIRSIFRTFASDYEKVRLFGSDNGRCDAGGIVLYDEVRAGRRVPAEQGEGEDGRRVS